MATVAGLKEDGDDGGSGEKPWSENSVCDEGDGELAQPKNAPSLDDAGDLGSGLLRLLLSREGVMGVVSVSLSIGDDPRLRCGGGDFRDNMDMVLVLILSTVVWSPADSGESARTRSRWS